MQFAHNFKQRIRNKLLIVGLTFMLVACNSGGGGGGNGSGNNDSGSNGGENNNNQTPQPGFNISLKGGTSTSPSSSGGDGGVIDIDKIGGSGPLQITSQESVDASFDISIYTPDFGPVPLTIQGSTALVTDPAVEPPAGIAYLLSSGSQIYLSDGDGNLNTNVVVTGLLIQQDASLVLSRNTDGVQVPDKVLITLTHDIHNLGLISGDSSRAMEIEIHADNYYGEPGSQIDNSARSDAIVAGRLSLNFNFSFINQGQVNVSGFGNSGGSGSDAGQINISAGMLIENTGTVLATGGSGGSGNGGNGNYVSIESRRGSLRNAGDIRTTGGHGYSGGNGGLVHLIASTNSVFLSEGGHGDLFNSGDINTSGGDAQDLDQTQPSMGGSAGNIDFTVAGGDLRNTGNLIANGGVAYDSTSTQSGSGGEIFIESYLGYVNGVPNELYLGDMLISGNIEANSGNHLGAASGSAMDARTLSVRFDHTSRFLPSEYASAAMLIPTKRLAFIGYSQILVDGGNATFPGAGGYINITHNGSTWDGNSSFNDAQAGITYNDVDLFARGGDAIPASTQSWSGAGGAVIFLGDTEPFYTDVSQEAIVNWGEVNVSGGSIIGVNDNVNNTGWGGTLNFYGTTEINQYGDLIALGGTGGNNGGTGGGLNIFTQYGAVNVTGTYLLNGGDAQNTAGSGGLFQIESTDSINQAVSVDVTVEANGGNAILTAGSGGGFVLLDNEEIIASGSVLLYGGDADVMTTGSVGGNGGTHGLDAPLVDSNNLVIISEGGRGETAGIP